MRRIDAAINEIKRAAIDDGRILRFILRSMNVQTTTAVFTRQLNICARRGPISLAATTTPSAMVSVTVRLGTSMEQSVLHGTSSRIKDKYFAAVLGQPTSILVFHAAARVRV